MVLDVCIGLAVLVFGYRASRQGAMGAVWSLLGVGIAAAAARYLSRPTARWMVSGIEWSYNYAIGLSFVVEFALFLLVMSFALGPMIQSASDASDGGVLDEFVGGLVGLIRGAVILYCVLAGVMLCTQRLGAGKTSMAFQYQKSHVGRWVMTHNLASPEPFPHAWVLRAIVGQEEGIHDQSEVAVFQLRSHAMTEFIRADPELQAHIVNANWKPLRKNLALLALTTNPDFLYFADIAMTPQHKVRAENPEDRFDELRDQ